MDTAATAKAQANSPGTKPKEESFGFEVAHLHEREGLALNSRLSVPDGMGLALSGGGIRSASFALGVVQSLLNEQVWHRFDYLSTVSGGGYLGAALSWWMHQVATDPDL
jgi:predicted acylesterase/phospholipase RssA